MVPVAVDAGARDLRSVARGGALNLVGAVVYGASAFVLVVLVSRHLGAEGTGELLLAIAAFNILVRVAELGASTGCVRFISRNLAARRAHEIPTLLRVALLPVAVSGTLIGLVAWVSSNAVGDAVADPSSRAAVAAHLRVIALILPVATVYSVAVQGSRGFGTMRVQATVDRIGRPLVQLALVQLALLLGATGVGLDLAWAGPFLIATVPTAVWVRRLVTAAVRAEPPRPAPDPRTVASELWRFSLPRLLGQTFTIVVLWFDTLLIGAPRSAEEAGIYAASTRYLLIGTFIAEAVMQVLGPNISRLLTRDEVGRAQMLFRTATAWQVCLIWPIFLVVAIFSPVLLSVFGEEFVTASTALTILAVGMLVTALIGPGDTVVLMAGRSGLSMLNSGLILGINVVLNLLLTPTWGIEGAAVAWAAALVASSALPALQLRSVSGIRLGGPVVIAAVAAALCFGAPAALARWWFGPEPLGLVVALVIGLALGAAVAWRLRRRLALDDMVLAFRGPWHPGPPSGAQE